MLRFKVAVLFKEFPMETSTKDPSQPTHQEISTFILKHKQTRWSMQNTKMSGSNRNTGGQAGVITSTLAIVTRSSWIQLLSWGHLGESSGDLSRVSWWHVVCDCFWQDLNLKLQEDMQHAADASALKQAGAVKTCAATWFCSVLLSNMQSTLAYLPHMNMCVYIYIYIQNNRYTLYTFNYSRFATKCRFHDFKCQAYWDVAWQLPSQC